MFYAVQLCDLCAYIGLPFPEPQAGVTHIASGMFVAYVDHRTNTSLVRNYYAFFNDNSECGDGDAILKNLSNKLDKKRKETYMLL